MKTQSLRRNEHFQFAERIESGTAARALQDASANGTRKLRTRFGVTRGCAALFLAIIFANVLNVSAQQIPQVAPRAIPVAPAVAGPNDIARFLAGMPIPENSPLAPLTRDQAWQAHSAFFEGEFTKLYQRQLQKLHAWEATNLPEVTQPVPVAFYMFSGPDFLYVDQFFPNASVYVLCGKESMGPPPDPLRIPNLPGALGNLENAMKSSLNTTYFITKSSRVSRRSAISFSNIVPASCRTMPEFLWLTSTQTSGTCVSLAFISARSISSNNITSPDFRSCFNTAIRRRSTLDLVIAGITRKPI